MLNNMMSGIIKNKIKYYDEILKYFNEWLDEQNPMEGILYSRALYERDYDAYYQKYSDWYDDNNLDNLADIDENSMLDMDYEF